MAVDRPFKITCYDDEEGGIPLVSNELLEQLSVLSDRGNEIKDFVTKKTPDPRILDFEIFLEKSLSATRRIFSMSFFFNHMYSARSVDCARVLVDF